MAVTRFGCVGLLALLLLGCGALGGVKLNESLGSPELQRDAERFVLLMDQILGTPPCSSGRIIAVRLAQRLVMAGGLWRELWTVEGCGRQVNYNVDFRSDPKGGTFIGVRRGSS